MLKHIIAVVALAVLGGGPAWGAKVFTTALVQGDTGDSVNCGVSNAGKKDLLVAVQLVNGGGALLLDNSGLTVVAGGANRDQQTLNANPVNHFVFCRFTVLEGSAKDVRASLCLRPGGAERCALSLDAR